MSVEGEGSVGLTTSWVAGVAGALGVASVVWLLWVFFFKQSAFSSWTTLVPSVGAVVLGLGGVVESRSKGQDTRMALLGLTLGLVSFLLLAVLSYGALATWD